MVYCRQTRGSVYPKEIEAFQETVGFTLGETSEIVDFRINSGYYDTMQDLLKEMNNVIGRQTKVTRNSVPQKGDELKFRYNEVNRSYN